MATEISRIIEINPISRIEGHGKVVIQLDDSGNVADAKFHVTQFRGFEKFCEGRVFWEISNVPHSSSRTNIFAQY